MRRLSSAREAMKARNPIRIRRDLRNYLDMLATLRSIGDVAGIAQYTEHVRAIERELELARTGIKETLS